MSPADCPRLRAYLAALSLLSLLLLAPSRAIVSAQELKPDDAPVQAFADKLLAADNDDARRALLAENKNFVTPELTAILVKKGAAALAAKDTRRALAANDLARRLAEEGNDHAGAADALAGLGDIKERAGEYAEARALYEGGLRHAEAAGDGKRTASLLRNIAVTRHKLGDFAGAIESQRRALALAEAAGDRTTALLSLQGISSAFNSLGDYVQSLEYARRSLPFAEATGDKSRVAFSHFIIGLVYTMQGNHSPALEEFRKALALSEEANNKTLAAQLLVNIGNSSEKSGDLAGALVAYERIFSMRDQITDKPVIPYAILNTGRVRERQGDLAAALELYGRALAEAEKLGVKILISQTLFNIASAHEKGGDYAKAVEYAERAARLAREIGVLDSAQIAWTIAGRARRALKQTREARAAFERAIETAEDLRRLTAGGARDSQRQFETSVAAYKEMVAMLVAEGDAAGAFQLAERTKSRALLDVIASGGAATRAAQQMTGDERAEEERLRAEITTANRAHARESSTATPERARLDAAEERLRLARLAMEAFETRLYAARPEVRAARGATPPLDMAKAAGLLPDDDSALLEFIVTDARAFLFVLTRKNDQSSDKRKSGSGGNENDGSGENTQTSVDLKVYPLAATAKELAERAEAFRRAIAGREAFQSQARSLYDLLLRPAAAELRGKRTLVIVPDGALWNLPFQVLQPAPNRYLLEDASLSYAPSLTALAAMRDARRHDERNAPDRDATLLAFGNPAVSAQTAARVETVLRGEPLVPLVAAEKEVAALGALYGAAASRVYTGDAAREDRAKLEAGRFRVVQFAAHGVLDDRDPMYSRIVLSQADGDSAHEDGLLEAWELMRLDLRAEMVVLSACETARGRVGAGEGVIGLSWALFVAGTPTIVVSQWKVSSASTAELMVDFHRHLKNSATRNRTTKAAALQQAALKLMRSGGAYRHPFYWAAFVVVGDGN